MKPKISVCIATYNGELYLKEQLDSIYRQTLKPFEVIISDDNSSDATLRIAENFSDKLPLKIIQNQKNLGFVKNFESVIQAATGEFIALCDQDDVWVEDKLAILYESIGASSLVYANSLLVDAQGKSLKKTLAQKLKNNFISSKSALNFLYDNAVSAHAILFKQELVSFIIPFPKQTYFDAHIAATAASLEGVVYVDETLVCYRQHAANTLGNKKSKKRLISEKIKEKLHKKEEQNRRIISTIEEFLTIETLNKEEIKKLKKLLSFYKEFEKSYFNIAMFVFLLKNKNDFFTITKRNKLSLAIKNSIGYKLYKVAPFL
ncbi:MAG: glycosyltransferase [Sulfurimonas sp.]|jgi:glycosyltransferase involved in cell wall biosynthesis|nr:glycosyltransferase [Sulfurimonas sp.]